MKERVRPPVRSPLRKSHSTGSLGAGRLAGEALLTSRLFPPSRLSDPERASCDGHFSEDESTVLATGRYATSKESDRPPRTGIIAHHENSERLAVFPWRGRVDEIRATSRSSSLTGTVDLPAWPTRYAAGQDEHAPNDSLASTIRPGFWPTAGERSPMQHSDNENSEDERARELERSVMEDCERFVGRSLPDSPTW